ncbi:hypothetical protein AGMMS50262_08400 [Bacteroidia bacterium]|nr:hypothetical protein AGMMS50262_08400 [Bacteroidia bacterium]GHU78376.1 hypothetical protein FACS1894145_0120 [Bacteroidia bacterium]
MVRGIEKFREYFADYADNYIVIGGTACDILQENAGLQPRATKDIDIILIVEALTTDFVQQFWNFIKAGNYKTRQRGNAKSEFFRFLNPENADFPLQIELFARKLDNLIIPDNFCIEPIPADEDLSSLSAILMNDDYYHFTLEHSTIEENLRLANIESLIILKAKAFFDLSERKVAGEAIDEKNIRKHKNDIFRLTIMLTESDNYVLPTDIQSDMNEFCYQISDNLPQLDLAVSSEKIFEILCKAFNVKL